MLCCVAVVVGAFVVAVTAAFAAAAVAMRLRLLLSLFLLLLLRPLLLLHLQSISPTLLLYVFRPCKASTLTSTFLKTIFLYSWVLVGAFRFIAGSGSRCNF